MPDKPQNRFSISYNFDLFTEQLFLFPRASIAIAFLMAAATGIQGVIFGLEFTDNLAVVIIYLAGLAGLKSMWLFAFYPMLYGTKFPGSLFIVLVFVTSLLMVFVAGGFFIIFPLFDETYSPPPFGVLWFFGIFFFLSFYACFKISHAMLSHRRGFRFLRKQIGLED